MIPPQLTTLGPYAIRLLIIGVVFGVISAVILTGHTTVAAVLSLLWWVLSFLAAGAVGPLAAKRHRSGPGYPAEPEQWLIAFSRAFTITLAVLVLVGWLGLSLPDLFGGEQAAGADGSSVRRVLMTAILAAIAVIGGWLLSTRHTLWLLYGSSRGAEASTPAVSDVEHPSSEGGSHAVH
ncbi:hypothetical protein M3A96_00795 [Helcobacillus massiliensis]|uniref:Uncharacterized protein n=1 Tax=Helcobacillus massiliensis TaxID=521392 RepID=A0A839R2K0_9MICO|nr:MULTISPECIES: hypothetical protein [Helcobacillus]MBB3023156.1 hypothetical protein [Helcobacillus massiliensis]MCG7427024.1 hypothetical protein [Helcobacillus sp. ACRRO]MCT1556667.1 hypothetical protein [Helcobacillus massiliensis]MCT2035861.1 hypothetical protein [Helcobacillus massiliensis]MCT2331057.1 hypothetical protein [Helcobacillus massiliensis]